MKLSELPDTCLPSRVLGESVYFIDAGHDRLPEPLYQISLERLCEQGQPVKARLPLDILPGLAEAEGLAGPRGLIFHTGRCGSTLLANMLGAHPAARMIKEPEAFNQILLDRAPTAAVGAVLRAFGRGMPAGTALLLKCTNWNVLEIRRLLSAFGAASALFLWRPAVEVVASCLDVPPPWVSWQHDPGLRDTWYPDGPDDVTDPAVFYAHAWRVCAAAALGAAGEFPGRVRILSYAELRADLSASAAASARYFGLPVTPDLVASMTGQAAMYSKNPSVRFDPGGRHARRQPTPEQRAAVERLTGPLEAALRSFR
jgi:hypothetical protein